MVRAGVVAALLLGAAIAGGCALNPTVAELRYQPGRYYDRTVAVKGVVTSAWGVPLLPVQLYKVDDGTGEVTVLSRAGRTPTRGARVRVTGKVADVAVLGGRPLGLHIREMDLDFERR